MSETKPKPAVGRAGSKKELPEHFKAYKGVWVFVEYEHGQIHPVSLELLGEGRKLADKLKVDLAGVIMGSSLADVALAGGVFRVRCGRHLSGRRPCTNSLPQRTLHAGNDRLGQ